MDTDKIVNFLFEVASLRRLTRSHRQVIQDVTDNISDHSFRVAVIGMLLAELEQCDSNRVVKICLFHDLPESRTGDANVINKFYLDIHEKEAYRDQLNKLPIAEEITNLLDEYSKRESKESIVAKDADILDQIVLEQEYFYKDKLNKDVWQNYIAKNLKTESAKKLALKVRESNPFEWLYILAEEKSGKKIER